jgi:hypothetical protein
MVVALLVATTLPLDIAMAAGAAPKNPHASAGASTQPTDSLRARYDSVMDELKLPADKAPAVRKILDDHYKSLTEWVVKVDPEVVKLQAQMRAIHGSSDPKTVEQAQAAMKRYRQLQAEMAEQILSALEPLGKVLTAEQVETARSILLPQPKSRPQPQGGMAENPFHQLANLNLSQEQVGKIGQIMDAARAAKEKDKSGTAANPDRQAWERIIKEVLTNEQRAKLEAARTEAAHRRMALAIIGGLELTEEQMAKVDAIWKEAYEAAVKKPQDRMDIYSNAQDKIVAEVLTDAQRKQLEAGRGGSPHPMPPGMMGGK